MSPNKSFMYALAIIALTLQTAFTDETSNEKSEKVNITVSKETTVLLSPLNDDGTVNYVKAMDDKYRLGATPGNNAFVVMMKVYGPSSLAAERREQYFQALGMKLLPMKGDYFVLYEEYFELIEDDDAPDPEAMRSMLHAMTGYWTSDQHPHIAAWLKQNQQHLDTLVAGLSRPKYYCPYLSSVTGLMHDTYLPYLVHNRDVAEALAWRAMLHTGEGRFNKAMDDLQAINDLTQHLGSGMTVVENLVATAIHSIQCRTLNHIALSGKLTRDQLATLLQFAKAIKPLPRIVEVIDAGERYVLLDLLQFLARCSDLEKSLEGNKITRGLIKIIRKGSLDWDYVLKHVNREMDKLVKVMRITDFKEFKTAIDSYDQYFDKTRKESIRQSRVALSVLKNRSPPKPEEIKPLFTRWFADFYFTLMLPSFTGAEISSLRTRTYYDVSLVAVALMLYHADHGGLPERLDDLSPKYLEQIPVDRYTAKPLVYRANVKGFTLYSIGGDMEDDGGRHDYNDGDIAVKCNWDE